MDDRKKAEEIAKKLEELNKVITGLDVALKQRAVDLLFPLYFQGEKGSSAPKPPKDTASGAGTPDLSTAEAFFKNFSHKRAADNVLMIAAWLYSQHGVYPITAKEVKSLADKAGLTIADRSDNTLRQAKKDGKSLFRQDGKGWEPTLAGEAYLKETFGVTKGNRARQ